MDNTRFLIKHSPARYTAQTVQILFSLLFFAGIKICKVEGNKLERSTIIHGIKLDYLDGYTISTLFVSFGIALKKISDGLTRDNNFTPNLHVRENS